jgi:26S proteasome regulatory subunit N5
MSGGLLKPEKDFTKDADKLIPEAEGLAKVIWKNAIVKPDANVSLDRCPGSAR